MTTVRLYGREGCHLCEQALGMLERIRASGTGFRLEIVDIEAEDGLHAAYLERIPVIEIDGRIVSELVPDEGTVRASLDTVGT